MSEQRGLPTNEDIQEGLRAFGRLMSNVEQAAEGFASLALAVRPAMGHLSHVQRLIEAGVFSYPGGGLDVRAAESAIATAVALDAEDLNLA